MNAPRKTFWDYPSSEKDLPGTKTYNNYIWQARFFGGDMFKSDVNQLGYYAKYYTNRYLYFAGWWINRIWYFTKYYVNRFFYFAWAYAKRLSYFTWAYIKRACYFAWVYAKRGCELVWAYGKRAAYLGAWVAPVRTLQLVRSLILHGLHIGLSLAVKAKRAVTVVAVYGWAALTRPHRAFARVAALAGARQESGTGQAKS